MPPDHGSGPAFGPEFGGASDFRGQWGIVVPSGSRSGTVAVSVSPVPGLPRPRSGPGAAGANPPMGVWLPVPGPKARGCSRFDGGQPVHPLGNRNIGEQGSGPLPLTDVAFAHGCSQAHPPETPAGAPRATQDRTPAASGARLSVGSRLVRGCRLVHEWCAVGDVDQGKPPTTQHSRPAQPGGTPSAALPRTDAERDRTPAATGARLSVCSRVVRGWGC